MTEVVAPESGETPKLSAETAHPPTPPTNPTNSSEPLSPNEHVTPEKPSISPQTNPTTTSPSTPSPNFLTPKAESSNVNPTSSEVPVATITTSNTTTTTSPSAPVRESAASVANPVSNHTADPTSSPPKDVAPTPTTITVQNSHDSSNTEPSKPPSPKPVEQRDDEAPVSETAPSDTRPDSSISQPQPTYLQSKTLSEEPTAESKQNRDNPASSAPKIPSDAPRPQLKRLPRVAKNRPNNSRVFIGNLASEYTSSEEIIQIFQQYGTLIEEPVLRRSFGFVQYSTAEAASKAAQAEQGRLIGGIGIDLSIADNREVKKGTHVQNNTPFQHNKSQNNSQPTRGRVRERESSGSSSEPRKKMRALSPTSAARKGGVHPPQYRRFRPEPKNGVYLRILCMSPTAKGYAKHCENTFRTMTGLKADILHILAAGLGEALGRAMRDIIPYVMVVASKDVDDGTCTIRTLEKTGYEKSGRGNGIIPLREAVEVCLIERGVIAPASMTPQNGVPGASSRTMGPHGGVPMHARGPPPQNGAQWRSQGHQMPYHVEGSKPGWMTGPRAPPPGGQGGQRLPPNAQPPPLMSGTAPPRYGYGDGRPPYGHAAPPLPPPPPPSQVHNRQNTYARGGEHQSYDMASTGAPGPNISQDYGRGGHLDQYQSHMNPSGGYPDRYGAGQQVGRGNGYGQPNGGDTEYDPAAVMPSQRPTQPGSYPPWNRDQGQVGRDTYNNGPQEPVMEPPPSYQQSSQQYSNQMYGSNQGYNNRPGQIFAGERPNKVPQFEERQPQNYNGRGGQGQFDSYENNVAYRRDDRRNRDSSMNQPGAPYSNDGYNSSNRSFQSEAYPPRDNQGGWDRQQPAPPLGLGIAPTRYGNQPMHPQNEGRGYGTNFRSEQSQYGTGRPGETPTSQYNVGNSAGEQRDPRNNQRYGAVRGGNGMPNQQYPSLTSGTSNMQSQETPQAPGSGAGTVDIGKLTNLISAFHQKQQQNSQQSRSNQHIQQQQSQPPQQQQAHQQYQKPQNQQFHNQHQFSQPNSNLHNQGADRGMPGDPQGVAHFLQMPGVQQALQNIGGTNLGGYQGGYQQGTNQQNLGMGAAMGQNRGRGPDQRGHPHQSYYG